MAEPSEFDFIIVGQGLAGTLLSHFLLLEDQHVAVIDYPHPGRTSSIAAGLINPVTGRRIAKSWRFEELFLFAKQTYHELEVMLEANLWADRQIARALHNNFEVNEWLRRSSFAEFQDYLFDEPDMSQFEGKLHPPHAWGELRGVAQVALPVLIEKWQGHLSDKGMFILDNVDYQQIEPTDGGVRYKGLQASNLVFCEGAKAVSNPFFNHLPFVPTKGELMLIRIPELEFERILKHNIFIIPMEAGLYWAGATSRYEFDGPLPSEYGRDFLVSELEKTLAVPFEIIEHLAGIRPTVADVRPFLGLHPDFPCMSIFNGLGTKGALMGPFFAKQMANYLLGKGKLDEEVEIGRVGNVEQKGHNFTKPA
ncbi:MAG: FAD-binding oxidoreductase [Saprospiraceae bacterium]|nr:FAD-binding oxidoreductase [Saprospiraceae bacterium]